MSINERRNFLKLGGVLAATSIVMPGKTISSLNEHFQKPTLKPNRLQQGDTIAIAGLAGAVWEEKYIDQFRLTLIQLGFNVKVCNSVYKKHGYLSGTDEERSNELMECFTDHEIKGIFCMKGGWGSARILDKIDYDVIQKNPKVFMGFSDITSLLFGIYKNTGLVTFHGPVGYSSWNPYSIDVFKNVVCSNSTFEFPSNLDQFNQITTMKSGIARGELLGGNLSVISSIIGSDYISNWDHKILFLEETHEEPYKLDRLLTHLKLAGVFSKINGLIFGNCAHCEPEEPLRSFTTLEVLKQHFENFHIPVFVGAPIGHIEFKWTLPFGVLVEMDADKGSLKLLENAVL